MALSLWQRRMAAAEAMAVMHANANAWEAVATDNNKAK